MRGEPDAHPVVDIEPLRMVVHALADQSHVSHEAESRGKILELQFAFEGTPLIGERPGGEVFRQSVHGDGTDAEPARSVMQSLH